MTLPDPADERGHQPDPFLMNQFEEKPIWCGLYENIHDWLFPAKLPPLELTSEPIAVPDRMATKANPWAVGTATLVNGGILALVLLMGVQAIIHPPPQSNSRASFKLDDFPLISPADAAHGGGGGGSNDSIDPIKGRNPKLDMEQLAPVQIPVLEHPKLAIDNSVAVPPEIKLPDNAPMPMVGVHSSANVTLLSGGQGTHGGIGIGDNGGDGPGNGPGWGPGRNGGAGGDAYTPGVGGVTQPIPIFTPEAEFSDEARRQKYQGVCTIALIVDAEGNPRNLRVVQALGMGLDQKALDAVAHYRFKPAKKDGKPVAARMTVMVNFRLY